MSLTLLGGNKMSFGENAAPFNASGGTVVLSPPSGGGKRKQRKSRKSRKSRKTHKTRKTRKSRKSRKSRK
jgi:hypothetical protein